MASPEDQTEHPNGTALQKNRIERQLETSFFRAPWADAVFAFEPAPGNASVPSPFSGCAAMYGRSIGKEAFASID